VTGTAMPSSANTVVMPIFLPMRPFDIAFLLAFPTANVRAACGAEAAAAGLQPRRA
jgi:hypothetical protein